MSLCCAGGAEGAPKLGHRLLAPLCGELGRQCGRGWQPDGEDAAFTQLALNRDAA